VHPMSRSNSTFFGSLIRSVLIVLVLAISAGLVVFAGYLLHLDREVQASFAGVRWVLPAQVYAAPLEIYAGAPLDAAALRHELERVGYRPSPQLAGAGTYSAAGDRIEVDIRPFSFWDGMRPEKQLAIRTAGNTIADIQSLDSSAHDPIVRLDPLLIGSIYPARGGEDRVLVKLAEVPPLLTQTLLLVEDRGFYEHIGISFRGIARALIADMQPGAHLQGASTITQQLIRNLFLNNRQTLHRKVREMMMAILLERHVSKDEILEAYLNEVELGHDGSRAVHGFGLASFFYFNKPLPELRPDELAMLVAMCKGSSYYNPRKNPDVVIERRNLVLNMMGEAGLITRQEQQLALARPLGISGLGGAAVSYPAFIDLVRRQLQTEYQEADLTSEGLRIFTTLNPRVQEALEKRIDADLPDIEKAHRLKPETLEAAAVVTSVTGGEIEAISGGRDGRYAGFNRALDSRRQIGSLAKPLIYLTALEQSERYTLTTVLHDQPIDLKLPTGQVWSPHNYDSQLHGDMPLYLALAKSLNLPTLAMALTLGTGPVIKTYADAGFDGAPNLPSMFLGAVDMAPLDVAQVYSTLAAGGYRTPLMTIREVQNRDGQPVKRYRFEVKQMLPEGPVYLVTWAMQRVIELGTARWATSVLPPGQVFAGKTGTTDDLRDSWFAGFGGDKVAVVWVGRDDNKPTGLEGATGALRIWGRLMRDLDAKGIAPVPPPEIETVLIDPLSGLLADAGCPETIQVPYLKDSWPKQYAPCANAAKSPPTNWFKSIFQ
jgi:penicillin-binding protein 1B